LPTRQYSVGLVHGCTNESSQFTVDTYVGFRLRSSTQADGGGNVNE
jgi:hypothetical protein